MVRCFNVHRDLHDVALRSCERLRIIATLKSAGMVDLANCNQPKRGSARLFETVSKRLTADMLEARISRCLLVRKNFGFFERATVGDRLCS